MNSTEATAAGPLAIGAPEQQAEFRHRMEVVAAHAGLAVTVRAAVNKSGALAAHFRPRAKPETGGG